MGSLRIGTRGSQLALFQANAVATLLRANTGTICEVTVIKTSGDRLAEAPLSQIGGKRVFVKEIEDALLEGTVDLAVHSSKDMPAVLPEGLTIGAVLPREDARDALVLPGVQDDTQRPAAESEPVSALEALVRRLGEAPRIGTSSVRRTAQLAPVFPGARYDAIRGNLDTRLRKLDGGEFDALVLAAAGLKRLGHDRRISALLPVNVCVPAPGQGIIAVEVRQSDTTTRDAVARITNAAAEAALTAERAVVTELGGGCQMPIGAYATVTNTSLSLTAIVVSTDGTRAARAEVNGPVAEAGAIGAAAAARLLELGAAAILAEAEHARAAVQGLQP